VREAEEAGTHILFSNSTATAVKWRKGRIVRALWISADDGQRECAGARGIISFRLYNIARDIDVPSPNALYPLILHLLPMSVIIEISFRLIYSSKSRNLEIIMLSNVSSLERKIPVS